MDILLYALRCLAVTVAMVPIYTVGILAGLFSREAGIRICLVWNRLLLRIFGIQICLENDNGRQPLHGCVFVILNQTSLLNATVGAIPLPKPWRGITNIEFTLIPFFGWAMWQFSWVLIRQWPTHARKTMKRVESFLREGGNIWVSIEGDRSRDGSLLPYKKGPAVLAINANARIIPVIHYGVRDCLPHGAWRIRPGKVTVRYLKAIQTDGLTYEDRNELVGRLKELAQREVFREAGLK